MFYSVPIFAVLGESSPRLPLWIDLLQFIQSVVDLFAVSGRVLIQFICPSGSIRTPRELDLSVRVLVTLNYCC